MTARQDKRRETPRERNRRLPGFTLVELMVVLTIIALLISIVAPHYVGRLAKAEEAVLQENLNAVRVALDKHYADTGRYPESLEELVKKRYLRNIPSDPVTQSSDTWVITPPTDRQMGGIYDIHSASRGVGSNGKPYAQW
jgi:general secretion pathway protein G